MFTLVTGGSASGKSEYAERIVPSDGSRIYLATMEPFGEEAERRIARHRLLREGKGFETVECPVNIDKCLESYRGKHVLLEDLPNLVANEIFSSSGNRSADILSQLLELEKVSKSLTCVTGILTEDGVQYDPDTTGYLEELARIEQAAAERADRVVEVVCGVGNELGRRNGSVSEKFADLCTVPGWRDKHMIFVTGPKYAGKREYIKKTLKLADEEFKSLAVWNAEELVCRSGTENSSLEALADELCTREIVIADEVGCGVVPVSKAERDFREKAGRLSCMLAERADLVIRVVCGCPQILKGTEDGLKRRNSSG